MQVGELQHQLAQKTSSSTTQLAETVRQTQKITEEYTQGFRLASRTQNRTQKTMLVGAFRFQSYVVCSDVDAGPLTGERAQIMAMLAVVTQILSIPKESGLL